MSSMRPSVRWCVAALAGLLFVLALTGSAIAKTKIVFAQATGWSEWTDAIKKFQEEYPDIEVEHIVMPTSGVAENLLKYAVAGQMPDVFTVLHDFLPGFLANGLLRPLEPFFARDNTTSQRDYVGLDMGPRGIWALPLTVNAWFTIYNRSMYAQAGVPYPTDNWTMSDLDRIACRLTADTNGDGQIDRWGFLGLQYMLSANQIDVYLWPFGASLFNEAGASALNTESAHTAFAFWDDLLAAGAARYAGGISGSEPVWMGGNAAMGFGDRVHLATMAQGLGFEWGLAPLPFQPGVQRRTVGTGHYFGISASTQQEEAAWTFLKWITGPKGHDAVKSRAPLPGNIRAFSIYQSYWESKRQVWNIPHNIGLVTQATTYATPPSITRTSYTAQQVSALLRTAIDNFGNRRVAYSAMLADLHRQLTAMQ